jgi:hypothetical protein
MPANWKTSLAGIVCAVAYALANYTGRNDWQGYLGAAAIAALGVLSKDFDAHSTVAQTQTATKEENDALLAATNSVK